MPPNPENTLEFMLGRISERVETICTKMDRHDEEQRKTIEAIRVEQKQSMESLCARVGSLERFRDGIRFRVGMIGGSIAFLVANAEPAWNFVKKLFATKVMQ